MNIHIDPPSPKQRQFLAAQNRCVAFGGARGGGKSWAVRTKAKLLCLAHPGIRVLIVRRTYPELVSNHIEVLRRELRGAALYNDRDKRLEFPNGSTIQFRYCARDQDLDRLQGVEYDVIFFDEATQLSEFQMRALTACVRGANGHPKRIYYTCNPGGQGHGYVKRLFLDRSFEPSENPADYTFIQSLVTDNTALLRCQPDYVKQLDALPPRLREAWRDGKWDLFEGQFFEEFRLSPDLAACAAAELTPEEARRQRRFTHVIAPFDLSKGAARGWNLLRSYDFGYARPFSCAWWAVDFDGTLYRILELYGCTGVPNEGLRLSPDEQFRRIAELERTHPWLRGRRIVGVADPSIFDASRGESIADMALRHGVCFSPGDNARVPGWMQCHYRLQFDENGFPRFYVFETCANFLRTIPLLRFSEQNPEDLDTEGEDHIADEWRYLCMSRPVRPLCAPPERDWTRNPLQK